MKITVLCVMFLFSIVDCNGELKMPVYFKGKAARDLFSDKQVAELANAAAKGKIRKIDKLVRLGVDVNALGKRQVTPLMWALCKRNKKGFKRLLEHAADPNIQLDGDTSVVSWAAGANDPFYLKMALKYGGNPNLENPKNKETPIFFTLMYGDNEKRSIEILLNAGADINHQQAQGRTVLLTVAGRNNYDLAYYLLNKGADPTITNIWGKSITDRIENNLIDPNSRQGKYRMKVIDLLHERGINVNPDIPKPKARPLIKNYIIKEKHKGLILDN